MKINFLPISGKTIWRNNKPLIWFLLGLLLIYSVLKIIFYNYNYDLLFAGGGENISFSDKSGMAKWSLTVDLLNILAINTFLLLALQAGRLMSEKISAWLILPAFITLNSFAVLLNLGDIFYFPFHLQRANADLLYVVDHPLKQLFHFNIFVIIGFTLAVGFIIFLIWKLHRNLYKAFAGGQRGGTITAVLVIFISLLLSFKNSFTKFLVPTYPLVELKSNQLPFVQNSFQTFFYSVFRDGADINQKTYFSAEECDSIFPIRKSLNIAPDDPGKKNVVLFIMESVPYDFFDSASAFKVAMPFFDSLLQKSTFYNNAFAYAHQSNKGITAILTAVPTLSDIPLYHSPYINMPLTRIGSVLKKNNYQSLFCIGDEYDNFGFAKCMNWLGFDDYYSKEDMHNDHKIPEHSMGLQDEVALDFLNKKLKGMQQPFFAVNYNISTHYPYNAPASFTASLPETYTNPMKSMRYYDHSLQQFFTAAKEELWFKETVFIFCSDHWMAPDDKHIEFNAVTGYRIPVIIYDPAVNKGRIDDRIVSQFDILPTILAIAGYKETVISYGNNLLDSSTKNEVVVCRANANLYHVIDSEYISGFNTRTDKAEFLFHYKTDEALKNNLVTKSAANAALSKLVLKLKAFLQKANMQYNNAAFK